MMTPAQHTLQDFQLRQTACREAVLAVFQKNPHALAHIDLENALRDKYDRVTLYRTLKTFLDKGLIHKVLDDIGGTKYALCKQACSHEEHNHDHVHFKCVSCGLTNCLDHVHIPLFQLPEGYTRQEINLLVQGICPACK